MFRQFDGAGNFPRASFRRYRRVPGRNNSARGSDTECIEANQRAAEIQRNGI
jgi:hypothetical protein